MNETGVPGFFMESWYGLMAPADTPVPSVARLHKEVITASGDFDGPHPFHADGQLID